MAKKKAKAQEKTETAPGKVNLEWQQTTQDGMLAHIASAPKGTLRIVRCKEGNWKFDHDEAYHEAKMDDLRWMIIENAKAYCLALARHK